MLTVETDPVVVEQRLGSGGWRVRDARVGWPGGVVRGPGWSVARTGRGRCAAPVAVHRVPGDACAAPGGVAGPAGGHRRGDRGGVDGEGERGGASADRRALGRPPETVRGWLRRFAGRVEPVRAVFTGWCRALDPDPVLPGPAGSAWADAIAAIHAAVRAVHARFGAPDATLSPAWSGRSGRSPSRSRRPGCWPRAGPSRQPRADQHELPLPLVIFLGDHRAVRRARRARPARKRCR